MGRERPSLCRHRPSGARRQAAGQGLRDRPPGAGDQVGYDRRNGSPPRSLTWRPSTGSPTSSVACSGTPTPASSWARRASGIQAKGDRCSGASMRRRSWSTMPAGSRSPPARALPRSGNEQQIEAGRLRPVTVLPMFEEQPTRVLLLDFGQARGAGRDRVARRSGVDRRLSCGAGCRPSSTHAGASTTPPARRPI